VQQLLDAGHAYRCFCTSERLDALREEQRKKKKSTGYDGYCRQLTAEDVQAKLEKEEPYVVRFKVPADRYEVVAHDAIVGEVKFKRNEFDDHILVKSDGFPTYHLAAMVDDHLMEITHIVRGVEWISSIPKHVFLFEAFGWQMPALVHLPVLLESSGGKLSKRQGAVSTIAFLREGYIPEAVLNFLMLLGWAPKDERDIISLEEYVDEFDIGSLKPSSPIFDRKKLLWINGKHLREMPLAELVTRFIDWLNKFSEISETFRTQINMLYENSSEKFLAILGLVQTRSKLYTELAEHFRFFVEHPTPNYDFPAIKGLKRYEASVLLNAGKQIQMLMTSLGKATTWQHSNWEQGIRAIAEQFEMKHGDVFMLLRIMIVGQPQSPPLFEAMQLLGEKIVNQRIADYLQNFSIS
jgi:nondiscriminating glutamyl-tRNA synthetase